MSESGTQKLFEIDLKGALIFAPGDILLFYDENYPPDEGTGTNKVPAINRIAILLGTEGALSYQKRSIKSRVQFIPGNEIGLLKNAETREAPLRNIGEKVADFFRRHANNPAHFYAGMAALYNGNPDPFLRGQIYPVRPVYKTNDEAAQAWQEFKSKIQPMDILVTIDRSSVISRFIAWATDGPWSHVAACVGGGMISEMVTSGAQRVPIETYKGPQYWIATYRTLPIIKGPRGVKEAKKFADRMEFGNPKYSYTGAIRAGYKVFRGDHSAMDVPNSVMHLGRATLVAQYGGDAEQA